MVKKIKFKKMSFGEVVFSCMKWAILISVTFIILVPVIHIVAASFSSGSEVAKGIYLLPRKFSLRGYKAIIENEPIVNSYKNSIVYTVIGSVISTVLTICAAYPLSRKHMPGKGIIMLLFAFTMLFNGGLIPTFMVVSKLGLVNTMWSVILVNSLNVWIMIVVRTFFQSNIPEELYDAASIDGCNDLNVLWKVVLPLSKSIIAVAVLMYAVSYWNDFFNAIVYLHSESLAPLQVKLRELLMTASTRAMTGSSGGNVDDLAHLQQLQYVLKYSTIVAATLPMLCAYPFVQKYFVKGVMIGSIKG